MLTYDVEIEQLTPAHTAVVHGHVRVPEMGSFLGGAFGEVMQALAAQRVAVGGPAFARYRRTGDGFDVEAGFVAASAVTAAGRVEPGELPGGSVATTTHRGPYDAVAAAYDAVARWLAEHGYEPAGEPWECYLDPPGVAEPRTLVRFPCRRTGAVSPTTPG